MHTAGNRVGNTWHQLGGTQPGTNRFIKNTSRSDYNGRHYADDMFKYIGEHFQVLFEFHCNLFLVICFSIAPGNDLQAIIWTNGDIFYWRMYPPLDHGELKYWAKNMATQKGRQRVVYGDFYITLVQFHIYHNIWCFNKFLLSRLSNAFDRSKTQRWVICQKP